MIRVLVPGLLTLMLAVIGVLHLVWAFSHWPSKDKVTFTKTFLGNDSGEMPPPLVSAGAGFVLLGCGVLTLMVNGTLPGVGPQWLQLTGLFAFALGMLGRGAGGYFMNAGMAAEFQRWNTVLYSPLCLVMCALSVTVAVAALRR